jgi:predicted HAD superfamily Cof-like phosphohydrolase
MRKLWSFIVTFFNWIFRDPINECCEYENVKEFHQKFDIIVNDRPTHLTKRKLQERVECMQEELNEFKDACEKQDLAAQADALVDLVYFAKGTAVMLGLPWQDLWDDVHSANMEKVRGVGPRGHAVDCVKPAGWIPPQTAVILKDAGYNREQFCYPYSFDDVISEERCCDDQ